MYLPQAPGEDLVYLPRAPGEDLVSLPPGSRWGSCVSPSGSTSVSSVLTSESGVGMMSQSPGLGRFRPDFLFSSATDISSELGGVNLSFLTVTFHPNAHFSCQNVVALGSGWTGTGFLWKKPDYMWIFF